MSALLSGEKELEKKDFILFSGSSHPTLAQEIGEQLGISLGRVKLMRFPDGEVSVEIQESVRGKHVFIVQSIVHDPDRHLMELLVMVDAARRASAKSVVAVISYFGYCRQDRKDKPRVPITAKLVANLLEKAGVDRVLTMDLHTLQVEGFFDVPVDNLRAISKLISAVKLEVPHNLCVVAPDIGSVKLARKYAGELDADFAIVDKIRCSSTQVTVATVVGSVEGKDVLLADDMCSTGATLVSAAKACQEKGARRVFALVTHAVFVGKAVDLIMDSPIQRMWITNSIPLSDRLKGMTKLSVVSVASLFSNAIGCILSSGSISSL